MLARIYPKQVSIEIEQESIPADFYSAFETIVIGTIRVHPGARLLTPVGLGKVGSGSSILVREVDKEDFRGRRFSVHLGETDEIIAQIDGYARPGGGIILIEWEREAESFVNDMYLVLHESADVPLPEWVSLVRPDVQRAPVSRTTLIKSLNVFVQNSTNVFSLDQNPGKPPGTIPPQGPDGADLLTERELEVANLLADGLTKARIAEGLITSPHTVKTHVSNIAKKLQIKRKGEKYAMQLKKMGYGTGDEK